MDQAQINSRSARLTVVICGFLLLAFAVISYSAVLTKNATIDEPTQAMAGWLVLHRGDFRVETASPPLWECWAALGDPLANPPLKPDSVIWNNRTWDPVAEVEWSAETLYDTPGFDGDTFINRGRAMMLLLGVMLGCLIAYWSYKLAGPVAAIASTTLFCLDPNFIAHAPLIKGDVIFALVLLSLAYTVWQLGRRATIRRLLVVMLIPGLAINVKFSGVLIGPLLAILLLFRAMLPDSWPFLGRELQTRLGRLIAAAMTGLLAAACCFAITWACYGFRYRPAPSPAVSMDMQAIYKRAMLVETTAELMHAPTLADIAAHHPSAVYRFVQWADERHLLPQAMLAGLLYQHSCVQMWPAFLNGELYGQGRLSYFPLATLYKTPVTELLAYAGMLIVLLISVSTRWRGMRRKIAAESRAVVWAVLCLLIPFTFYTTAALTAHLNIGLRNALPLFPFLQISTGCAAAVCWHRWRSAAAVLLGILSIGLICETLSAWPDYIAFFNAPSGGKLGGIAHLGDSNLDWGQDIKSLARWQQQHPELPLYARLYDSVDPQFYGLRFHPLSIISDGPLAGQPVSDQPMKDGYIAVSATHLQGLYIRPWEEPFYTRLRNTRPLAVIGGTICIYEFH